MCHHHGKLEKVLGMNRYLPWCTLLRYFYHNITKSVLYAAVIDYKAIFINYVTKNYQLKMIIAKQRNTLILGQLTFTLGQFKFLLRGIVLKKASLESCRTVT